MCAQTYKKQTLGQEALLREKEEQILMERKRRYGALHVERHHPGTPKLLNHTQAVYMLAKRQTSIPFSQQHLWKETGKSGASNDVLRKRMQRRSSTASGYARRSCACTSSTCGASS